ncbi:MFS transporter [Streptomyces sp. NPDC021224]|uniref:MFS transporter n=1 Tax=unclassified Streptomyces TaxID=2593676 RepID=UPI0037A33A55
MKTAPQRTATGTAPPPGGLLAVLAGNMLIDALEVSATLVALPALGQDFHLAPSTAQWAMTAFAIGFGGLMLFGARVVAIHGARRAYLWALLAFAAASLVAGVTGSFALLVACRVVKGFCAALTAPTGLAIIMNTFPEGPHRSRAISVYTVFGAGGFTGGLLLSGLLTDISWRWTLATPAPAALLLFLLGLRMIPRSAPAVGPRRRYDVAGALSATGALVCLDLAIASSPAHGWFSAQVGAAAAGFAVLCALFVAVERTAKDPLVRLPLRTGGTMARSALGAGALNGSYLGLLVVVTFQFQTTRGWSPLQTALAILPASVPLALVALHSGRMIARFGTRRLIAYGALPPLAGYLLYLRLPAHPDYVTAVLPTMILVGLGFVLSFAALNTQATSGLAPAERGAAAALYQSAVQIAAVVAPALAAALFQNGLGGTGNGGLRPAVWLVVAIGAIGPVAALTTYLLPRPPRRATPGGQEPWTRRVSG